MAIIDHLSKGEGQAWLANEHGTDLSTVSLVPDSSPNIEHREESETRLFNRIMQKKCEFASAMEGLAMNERVRKVMHKPENNEAIFLQFMQKC